MTIWKFVITGNAIVSVVFLMTATACCFMSLVGGIIATHVHP